MLMFAALPLRKRGNARAIHCAKTGSWETGKFAPEKIMIKRATAFRSRCILSVIKARAANISPIPTQAKVAVNITARNIPGLSPEKLMPKISPPTIKAAAMVMAATTIEDTPLYMITAILFVGETIMDLSLPLKRSSLKVPPMLKTHSNTQRAKALPITQDVRSTLPVVKRAIRT